MTSLLFVPVCVGSQEHGSRMQHGSCVCWLRQFVVGGDVVPKRKTGKTPKGSPVKSPASPTNLAEAALHTSEAASPGPGM